MTHGRGKKGGRGAGLRGGRGNAGLCKHKFMYMNKYMPDHYGSHGFKRPRSAIKKDKIINVGQLEELFPGEKDIDLTKEGYDKLLGGGNIKTKIKIKVDNASEKAVAKIEKKGGEVLLPEEKFVEHVPEKSGEEKNEEVLEEKTEDKKD